MNSYICLFQTKVFSDELSRSYNKFSDGYYAKDFQKKLPKQVKGIQLPNPEYVSKYKQWITYGVGYFYLVGSVGLLMEMNILAIPMIIIHILQSILFDNPFVTST